MIGYVFLFVLQSKYQLKVARRVALLKITEENAVQQIKNRNEKAIAFIIQTYGSLLTAIIKRHVHYNEHNEKIGPSIPIK